MLGLSMQISHVLSLRESLETSLEQSLLTIQEPKLSLLLYKKREEKLTRLYRQALRNGRVKKYQKHGIDFEYALLNKKDVPLEIEVYGWAFSHCLYNAFDAFLFSRAYALSRGSWLLFVVYDALPHIPQENIEYGAVHERGEQVTLGDHNLASKLEFSIAKKEKRLTKYMSWIEKNYPQKFADVFSYQTHLQLPASDVFQSILELSISSQEALSTKKLIESFHWPYKVLQRLSLYKKKNEEALRVIRKAFRLAEALVDGSTPLVTIIENIKMIMEEELKSVEARKLSQYISYPKIQEVWNNLRLNLDNLFLEKLYTRQRRDKENYIKEILEAGISDSLPRKGVLSFSFQEAFQAVL